MVRSVAERVIGTRAMVRAALRRRPGQAFILAWHNIVPRGERPAGERSLHTDQAVFAEQLDVIADLLPVVRLRDLLEGTSHRHSPVAVLTFDDAYLGAIEAGGEELVRRGLPATVFVAPAFLGGRSFWWDAFADPETGELPVGLRDRALAEWAGAEDRVRAGMAQLGRVPREPPAHARAVSVSGLLDAKAGGVFELGAHTWSHPNLAALDAESRAMEIRRCMTWLHEHTPDVVPALALPYGLGGEYASDAEAAGLAAVMRIEGGWAAPEPAGFQVLPRFNVPRGLTPGGLRLRLAGLLT